MAIATDAVSNGSTGTAASLNVSHVVGSGSNRILWVSYFTFPNADAVTNITYPTGGSATALTKVGTALAADAGGVVNLAYLVNPDTGTANIAFTISPSSQLFVAASSYSGAAQTGVPDATTTTTLTGTSVSPALTTVADNCWIVMATRQEGGGDPTAGANAFLRSSNAGGTELFDTNSAQTPAGSKTLTITNAGSKTFANVLASMAPAGAAAVSSPVSKLSLLGVG